MFDFWYLYPLHCYTRESLHMPSFLNLLFAVTLNLSFRQTSLRPICGLGSFNPVCPCHKSLGKACKVWIQKFPRGKEILQYTSPQTFRCDAFSLGHKFSIWHFWFYKLQYPCPCFHGLGVGIKDQNQGSGLIIRTKVKHNAELKKLP